MTRDQMDAGSAGIRGRGEQLRAQGAELRRTAETLVTRALDVPWEGRAAESMRDRIEDRARRLRKVADAHERAADALDRHAAAVDGEAGEARPW